MATALLSFTNTSSDPRSSNSLRFMGGWMTIHADSQDTNGQFALIEFSGAPGLEPPLHIHKNEDEMFYVLEGKLKVYRGDEELILEPGDSAFAPRNIPHTFKILSSYVRALVYITPGGFEGYFREMSGETAEPVSPAKMTKAANRYGVSFVPQNVSST
jgi:quercetin dioxygenase-like cupin family protein